MAHEEINIAGLMAALSGDHENARIASTPGGVERQEAEGQAALCAAEATTLPRNLNHSCTRADLEKLGFVFGENKDDLFVYAQYPAGWKLKPTDHSMWSDLLDEQGRKRAGVFYKAAFYDRSAHLSMNSRFSINSYAGTTDEEIRQCQVEAEGGYVKVFGTYKRGDYDELERIEAEAKAWLTENYPDWKNRSAYWDLAVADIKV